MKVFTLSLLISLLHLVSTGLQAQDTLILQASQAAGFYSTPQTIRLQSNNPSARIFYTLDGSPPSAASNRYKEGIYIDTTKVLQAVAYFNGRKSNLVGNTYFIGEDTVNLPIVSISIRPSALFDPVRGLFKAGPRASKNFPHKGANYYSKRETPCYVEIFELDKQRVFQGLLGFKIFGGMSRISPQKSIALYARKSRYGKKYIKHQVFPEKAQKKYKRLVLRNSGSDFGETHFRDAFITSLGKEMGLDVQAYRPALVYINGQFWGIYNFREKLTRHYLSANFGYHKDSVNLIKHRKSVKAGSIKSYYAMQNFMRTKDLNVQANFDSLNRLMDIENFMEYEIVQIFIDNQDAGGNIKFWQPQVPNGRWRWILFDTDFGFGHASRHSYKYNSLAFHTKPDGKKWPNPPWSTFNLRMLLKNKQFQHDFVRRFADRMNTTFDSTYVIERIDSMANNIRPYIGLHLQRWKLTEKRWLKEIERMRQFARLRQDYIKQFIQQQFPFVGEQVLLEVQIEGQGQVQINEVVHIDKAFLGTYFTKLDMQASVRPALNYRFSHWELNGQRLDQRDLDFTFQSAEKHLLKAVFTKARHPLAHRVLFNEIAFRDSLSGDWIEFYNHSDTALQLQGWKLVDAKGNHFELPAKEIPARDFLVICKNAKKFSQAYPACQNYVQALKFGLNQKRESITLLDAQGDPVDRVHYNFSKEQAANLRSIALKDFRLNPQDPNSWTQSSSTISSPASVNPDYVLLQKSEEWAAFMDKVKKIGISLAILLGIVAAYVLTQKRLKKKG